MYVQAHELFKRFMAAMDEQAEASLVHSLAASPTLGDFLPALDADLSLDWSAQDFQGMPSLREKILHRTQTAASCCIADVLVTAGTAEANFLALNQLLRADDELIVDVPGWPQPLVLGEAIGAKVVKLPRREDRQWQIDIDALAGLVTSKTRMIFLCNPNNPTGQILHEEILLEVIALADKVGAYVLCDEVYAGLEWDAGPIARVANLYERGISTGSVSKVLGLQGLRLGWLICRDPEVVYDAMVLREDSSEIMNIMGEAIADIALDEDYYPAAIKRARDAGQHNRQLLDEFIDQHRELQWQRPAAGLIGFCHLQLDIDADEFARRLMQAPYRTFVMPGSAYGWPQHLRLGFGGRAGEAVATGLQRMRQFLENMRAES